MAWSLGQTPDVYTVPEIKFIGDGAPTWLAAAAVVSFSLERELVASTSPGTLRSGGGGLSIGAASASMSNVGAQAATPWSTDPDSRVATSESTFGLYAVEGTDQLNLGHWALDPMAGSVAAGTIEVNLIEAQYAGRRKRQELPPYRNTPFTENAPVDPCWVVGQMARLAGFPPVPPTSAYISLDVACDGAYHVDERLSGGGYTIAGETPGWEVLPGDVAVGGADGSFFQAVGPTTTPILNAFRNGDELTLSINVVGTVYVHDVAAGWQVRIVNNYATATHTIAVCNSGDGTFTTAVPFTPGLSSDWPNRVQVNMIRTWNESSGQWTLFVAVARSSGDASWSAEATDGTAHTPLADGLELIYCLGGADQPDVGIVGAAPGQFAAFNLSTVGPTSDAWNPSKAHLKPLGGDVGLPWAPADADAWSVIQDVCSAWLGAAIMGDGVIEMFDRVDLAGANDAGEVADIGHEWTELPWSLDPKDRADRVEVTFTPPELRQSTPGSTTLAPEAWRASEVITVPPSSEITIPATLENKAAVGIFRTFITPAAPSAYWSQSSNIFVFNNPDGTGSPLSVETVEALATQTSATTAVIRVRNRTTSPIYLVDGTGAPGLILRARTVATYETPQLVERGAPVEAAVNPLQVDLSPWVQREVDAMAVADFLWSRVSDDNLWKVGAVRCRLDWSHDIGKILRLVHSETGLEAKALITKVGYDGQPGEIAQTLDLVLLPWTWGDFDAVTASTPALDTWTELDTAYAGRTWNEFDVDPLWTP